VHAFVVDCELFGLDAVERPVGKHNTECHDGRSADEDSISFARWTVDLEIIAEI